MNHPVGEFGDRREVVVANREILPSEKITAEQMTIAPVPNGSVPEGAFRKLEQVVGRVSITPIGMRQTITNTKLAPSEVGVGFSAVRSRKATAR
jgi:Flp pilus assembly protein CpaB